MEEFRDAVQKRDAGGLRTLLAVHPEVRAGIDAPIFDADQPAIVFCRRDRPMVDALLDFGADINVRSQFWGRTVGVLDDNTPEMRAYLIERGAVPEIVRVLMEHGADLEIRNDYDGTALESCQWGSLNFRAPDGDYPACAEALLQGGARLSYPDFGSGAVQAVLRRYRQA